MGYGFSLFKNTADAFGLRLSTSKSPRTTGTQLLNLEGMQTTSDFPDSRLGEKAMKTEKSQPVQASETFYLTAIKFSPVRCLPPALIEKLSQMVANGRDIKALQALKHSSVVSTRNRAEVLTQLYLALSYQRDKIRCFDPNLPPWPQNSRQFHAARYRRTQLLIVDLYIEYIRDRLDSLYSQQNIITFDGILTKSPRRIAVPFRAAIYYSLRTRQAKKLKRNGYQDLCFTLWICTLWLVLFPRLQSSEPRSNFGSGSDSESDEDESFLLHLQQWLKFLSKHYRTPPGWEPSRHEDDKPLTNVTPIQDSQHLPTCEAEDKSEDFQVTASYLSVVKAAAERDQSSIYADERWTTDFLAWGLEIWKEEAVAIPASLKVTGMSGLNDELVLFLEIDE